MIGTASSKTEITVVDFVVGDVSGRGVEAAALMAKLRFTIPTLASLGYDPAAILQLVFNDLDIGESGHFATVLVGLIEDRQQLTVASAGHFGPLLINGESADFVSVKVGVPLGVGAPSFDVAVVPLRSRRTLVGFTDGLVETRSASINQGLGRLRRIAYITSQRTGRRPRHRDDGRDDPQRIGGRHGPPRY